MSASSAAAGAGALSAPLFRALTNSIAQNQMVEFSRYSQLATISHEGLPTVRTINVRDVLEEERDGRRSGLLRFSTDARSAKVAEFASMARSAAGGRAVAELCWFFPVTREQYRLRCSVQMIFSEGATGEAAVAASSPSGGGASASASGSASSGSASPSVSFPPGLVRSSAADLSAHASFWRSHSPESRALFDLAPPGSVRKRAAAGDLDRFEAQAPACDSVPSAHFVTVLLAPIQADYLKLPRPAEDTRGQMSRVKHYESNMQPSRQQQRWRHQLDEATGQWSTAELNP